MRMIEVIGYDLRVIANWACLNKNNTLREYEKECSGRGSSSRNHVASYRESMKVTHVVELTVKEWNEFTTNFLNDTDWLAGLGGTDSDYDLGREVKDFYELTEAERKEWRAQAYRLGLLVICKDFGRSIAVDPQGYNYARYVGLVPEGAVTI